jgi:hypothetical protein
MTVEPVASVLWDEMSPHQLLAAAQAKVEEYKAWREGDGKRVLPTVTHPLLIEADLMVKAAQVQATSSLEWTFENRLVPGISSAIWEGARRG